LGFIGFCINFTYGNSIAISQAARKAGFDDLRVSALKKCAQGVTSLEEVNRVTGD
jgi:type IV pilus assembly protein PilB